MSRLDQLHKMLAGTPGDPFLLYGIALEHKNAGETDLSLQYLDRTIAADGQYCYAFYQKGQVLESVGKTDEARLAYAAGISAAKACGDGHAQGELQGALDML